MNSWQTYYTGVGQWSDTLSRQARIKQEEAIKARRAERDEQIALLEKVRDGIITDPVEIEKIAYNTRQRFTGKYHIDITQYRPVNYIPIDATLYDLPPYTATAEANALWRSLIFRADMGWWSPEERDLVNQHKAATPGMWQPIKHSGGVFEQFKEDIVAPVQKAVSTVTAPISEVISKVVEPVQEAIGKIIEKNPWISRALTPPKAVRKALTPPKAIRDIVLGAVGDAFIMALKFVPLPGMRILSAALNVLQTISAAGVEYEEAKRAARRAAEQAAAVEVEYVYVDEYGNPVDAAGNPLSGLGETMQADAATVAAVKQALAIVEGTLEAADGAIEAGVPPDQIAAAIHENAPALEAEVAQRIEKKPFPWGLAFAAVAAYFILGGKLLGKQIGR